MEATSVATVYLLLIEHSATEYLPPLTLKILQNPMPCVVRADCLFCENRAEARNRTDPKYYDYFTIANKTLFATHLRYQCPKGSEFETPDPNVTSLYTEITCGWDMQWTPVTTLTACKGT